MRREQTIDILHLTDQGLRWLRLTRQGRRLELSDSGLLEGEPLPCLERWGAEHARPGAAIRLYDGRPRYYCFTLRLPSSARRGMAGAVALRVRQDLGVEPAQMAWATRAHKAADRPGMLDLFTVVARREDLEPIRQWAERHALAALWVGADIDAIQCLVGAGALAPPVVVLNGDPGGVTLFHAEAAGGIAKGRLTPGASVNGALLTTLAAGTDNGLARASFGQPDWHWLGRVAPTLERLPERTPRAPGEHSAGATLHLEGGRTETLQTDAVLLGGVHDLMRRSCSPAWLGLASADAVTPMDSLLGGRPSPLGAGDWIERIEQRLPSTRRVALAVVLGAVLLAATATATVLVRRQAQARLTEKVATLRQPIEIYRSQEATLRTIDAERQSLLPVIEAIHQVAPSGMQLDSLAVGAGGDLLLDCSTKNRNNADELLRALAASPLFTNVQVPVVKPDKNGFSFQLMAQIRDRQRQVRR